MKKLLFVLLVLSCVSFAKAQDTLTTKSGLKYVQTKKGEGAKPVKGQKVKVHYTGRLENGKVFDSSKEGGPFKFTLGNKEVIPGWDEGFMLMQAGEKGFLIIPANLAYGKKGVPDEDNPGKYIIPQNATLTFEVELISFK
jgi:peptidyl-prolyl cis-trans isomerase A (cyclophilin A)